MPTVDINITGGTYKHKSSFLSAQATQNFWPQAQQDNSVKSPYILESFPGLKRFSSLDGNKDRGMLEHNGVLYKVSGQKLYSIDSFGVGTELATVAGADRCIMEGIGANIVIVTGGNVYQWDGSTLTEGTDPDFETPNSCAHLNNQMLFDGDGGRFGTSDVGDALDINGLNYATAESNADDLNRVYSFNQLAYLIGEKTTEPWWNSGVGSPPFDRVEGGQMPIGSPAIHSVANDDEFMYMLGHDDQVYAISGSNAEPISPSAITKEFASYSGKDKAIGWCMNLFGNWMYVLTFPIAQKTWIYPKFGEWFEWTAGQDGLRSLANSYSKAYGKHLVGDYTSGDIFEIDPETYTNDGEAIIRIRDTGAIHGGLLGAAGKDIEMERFELICQTGVGLLSGQGEDPKVMLSFSDDGGKTFSTEMWGSVGGIGDNIWTVEWFNLGTFKNRIIRVKTSDPVYFSIHSAAADLEVCI